MIMPSKVMIMTMKYVTSHFSIAFPRQKGIDYHPKSKKYRKTKNSENNPKQEHFIKDKRNTSKKAKGKK